MCRSKSFIIYNRIEQFTIFDKNDNKQTNKDRIWDITLLENVNIATISRDNIYSLIKINENNFKIKGTKKKLLKGKNLILF